MPDVLPVTIVVPLKLNDVATIKASLQGVEYAYKVTSTIRPSGTNGETVSDQAISFLSLISAKSTVGNADIRTWAHEVGHGLGLRHVPDENNLMSASRHGQGGKLTGFEISQAQLTTMHGFYRTLTTAGF